MNPSENATLLNELMSTQLGWEQLATPENIAGFVTGGVLGVLAERVTSERAKLALIGVGAGLILALYGHGIEAQVPESIATSYSVALGFIGGVIGSGGLRKGR